MLEEAAIKQWAASASEGDVVIVKAKAKPFITWLEEAESDDESDDE